MSQSSAHYRKHVDHIDRDKSGHRIHDALSDCYCSNMLEHEINRQSIRNRSNNATIPESVAAVSAMKRRLRRIRRKAMMQRILFQFFFGSNAEGSPIASTPEELLEPRQETIVFSHTVTIPKGKQFELARLRESVNKSHHAAMQRVQHIKNKQKAEALLITNRIITETVNAWLDVVDEDVIRFNVNTAIETHCHRSLNIVTAVGNAGHVRIALDPIATAEVSV